MPQASYVFSAVRALLDDQEAEFATDDYLVPFLQAAQDDLTLDVLNHANLGRMKFTVTLPNVTAGTQSLADYFGDDQPLATLQQVIRMREKLTNWAEYLYSPMRELLVPQYQPPQNQLNGWYTFTGQDIIIPGSGSDEDIQIYGSFKPQLIQNADTPLVLGTEAVLREGTVAKVCFARGSTTTARAADEKREALQGSLFNNWCMQQQNIVVRARRFRQRGGGWDGNGDYMASN
jgi:hypothetical protein